MKFSAPITLDRVLLVALFAIGLLTSSLCQGQLSSTNAIPVSPPTVATEVSDLLSKSSQSLASSDIDSAVSEATAAIQLDPHSAAAYEQRGSIYIQKKLWDRAERDYTAADHISPDVAYKYKLAEIKYLQKSFDNARLRFVKLQSDEHLGDLATYKVFLCDFLGRHEAASLKDLALIDQGEKKPSYYFSHAAWDLYHDKRSEANGYIAAGAKLFGNSTYELYISSLLETQNFRPPVATFATKDGRSFQNARVFLETSGLRASTAQGWVTLPLDQLPDDLSAFPETLRGQILKKRGQAPSSSAEAELITFTTKPGKSYASVRWSLEDDGLSILSEDGWITIPFAQLPADLSVFPQDLQKDIRDKLTSTSTKPTQADQSVSATTPAPELVTFTTKSGKSYDSVRWSLEADGLSVLSPDGWIIVHFVQLPDDLSAFPQDLQRDIQHKLASTPTTSSETETVSFSTKLGKKYNQVRASVTERGIRALTKDGWVIIPFTDLPDDLSTFSSDWQQQIKKLRSGSSSDDHDMKVVSFTTKKGKHYTDVRAAMEKHAVRLLTSDGWIAVPFDQLPDDLSAFPNEWRVEISERQTTAPKNEAGK